MRKRTLHLFLLFLTALLFARPAQSQPTSRPLAPGDKADALTALLHAGRTVAHTGPLGTLHARSGHFRQIVTPRLSTSTADKKAPRLLADTGAGTELWGVVLASDSWSDIDYWDYPYGIYGLAKGATSLSPFVTDTYGLNINGGGAFYDDKFHGVNYYEYDGTFYYATYVEYTTDTWEATDNSSQYTYDDDIVAYATAYDNTTGTLYALLRADASDKMNVGTIDYSSLSSQVIGEAERIYVALAAGTDGTLYAIGSDGNLYRLSKTDGTATLVGSTGVKPGTKLQSATVDQATGTMYWAAVKSDDTSALYTVDTTSGAATKVMDFSDNAEIVCLYAPMSTNPAAPAAVENVEALFEGTSLTGTVSFDLPTTTAAGDALSGSLAYTVTDGTTAVATGTAAAGAHVDAPVTLAAAGKHEISVAASNASGQGKKTTVRTEWIGPDEPLPPSEVHLTISDKGHVLLTWTPVSEGMNDGAIDPTHALYTVTRQTDGKVVAENITDTCFEEDIDITTYTPYRYAVSVVCDGIASPWGASSNIVKAGAAFEIPWTEDFSSTSALNIFETLSVNGHGGWRYGYQFVSNQTDRYGRYASDAWLITPPLHLLAARAYYLRYSVCSGEESTQCVEAAYGQGTDPTAYTRVVDPMDVNSPLTYIPVEQLVRIDAAGDYRFGIHDISKAGADETRINRIEVVAGPLYTAPDSVTALSATAAPKGEHRATITFTAPTRTFDGQTLASLTKIEVVRDDSVAVATVSPAQPGKAYTCTDATTSLTDGWHTYTVTAYNGDGLGLKRTVRTYVGIDVPQAPRDFAIADQLDGTALFSWHAPVTVGINGGYVDTTAVRYNIYTVGDEELIPVAQTADRSITASGIPQTGAQGVMAYAVSATSTAGSGDYAAQYIIAGAPYTVPFHEGFPEGNPENAFWLSTNTGNGTFGTYDSMSADGDGVCAGFIPNADGDSAAFSSGKIALGETGTPVLTFSYYAIAKAKAALTVRIATGNSRQSTALRTIDYRTVSRDGWQKAAVDLSPYAGKGYVTLSFCAKAEDGNMPVVIDDIRIGELPAHDVAATLTAPARINMGANGEFVVGVDNMGSADARGVKVSLYAGDEVTDEQTVDVPAFTSQELRLHFRPTPTSKDSIAFHAVAAYAEDADNTNNTTPAAVVAVVRPFYPTVGDLSAVQTGNDVTLSWSAPDLNDGTVTETFDTYTAFSIANVGNWTLFDGDGAKTTSIYGASTWPHSQEPYAYVVFNPADAGLDLTSLPKYAPHSGSQYMAAFACDYTKAPLGHNDDWLITPELSGKAQTVSFYAKSVNSEWCTESYEVLYSTTDTDTASFVKVAEGDLGDEWTEITATLPAGAKYMAIRCVSKDQFIFMVDDVTYQGVMPQITGYNVYRDGQLLATVPSGSTAYTDAGAGSGDHDYVVTVVYADGESAASNVCHVVSTGIGDATVGQVSVCGGKGVIRIAGAEGRTVRVYATDGRLVATAEGQQSMTIAVTAGQYLVSVGGKTDNVIVK